MSFSFDIKTITYNGIPLEDYNNATITILYSDFTNSCKAWISEVFSAFDMEASKENNSEKEDSWFKFLLSLTHAVQSDSDFIKHHADGLTAILPFVFYDNVFFDSKSNSSNRAKKAIKILSDFWSRMVVLCSYSRCLKKKISRSDANGFLVEESEIKGLQSEVRHKLNILYAQQYNALFFSKNKVIIKKPVMTAALANLPNQDTLFIPALPSLYVLHAMTVLLNGKVGKKQDLLSLEFKNDSVHFPEDTIQIRYSTQKLLKKVESELGDTLHDIYQPIFPQKERPTYSGWLFYKFFHSDTNEKDIFFKTVNFQVPICKIRELANQITIYCELNSDSRIALLEKLPDLLYYVGRKKARKEIIASITENQESADKIDEVVSVLHRFCDIEFYVEETCEAFIQKSFDLINKLTVKNKYGSSFLEQDSTKHDNTVAKFLNKFFVFKDINKDILTCYGLSHLPLMEAKEYTDPVKKLGKKLKKLLENKKHRLVCSIEDKDIREEEKIKLYFQNNQNTISESIFKYMTLEDSLQLINTYGPTQADQAEKPSESIASNLLKSYLKEQKIELNKYVLKHSFPFLSKRALEIIGNNCLSIFYQAALYTFGFYDV